LLNDVEGKILLLFEVAYNAQDYEMFLIIVSNATTHDWRGQESLGIIEANGSAGHPRKMCKIINAQQLRLYVTL
jgi:hypothetical protein